MNVSERSDDYFREKRNEIIGINDLDSIVGMINRGPKMKIVKSKSILKYKQNTNREKKQNICFIIAY